MSIEDIARELYGLPPEEFTAARNARAKQAVADGERELAAAVRGLRRPTAAADVLNLVVRRDRATVEQVVELGVRLRAAQGTLGQRELRALDDERRALTRAVARQAVDRARGEGRTVSAAVTTAVEETLRSAMVDAEAGAALLTGLLVDTFSSTGLDPVDLSRVLAVGDAGRPPRPAVSSGAAPGPDPRVVAAARESAELSAAALVTAGENAESARRRAVEAARRRQDLGAELAELRRRVADLEQRLDVATEAEHDARRAQLAATRDEQKAAATADRDRRRLESLGS